MVRIGDVNLSLNITDKRVEERNISKSIKHPKYRKPNAYYDVGLLELDKPVQFNDFILPICIPTSITKDLNTYDQNLVTMTGYGKLKSSSSSIDGKLRTTNLKIYSQR